MGGAAGGAAARAKGAGVSQEAKTPENARGRRRRGKEPFFSFFPEDHHRLRLPRRDDDPLGSAVAGRAAREVRRQQRAGASGAGEALLRRNSFPGLLRFFSFFSSFSFCFVLFRDLQAALREVGQHRRGRAVACAVAAVARRGGGGSGEGGGSSDDKDKNAASAAAASSSPPSPSSPPPNRKKIVYLSADSDRELSDLLDPRTTLVVGGLVDRNRHRGAAASRAASLGMETARLPLKTLGKAVLSSSGVLTVDQTFALVLAAVNAGGGGGEGGGGEEGEEQGEKETKTEPKGEATEKRTGTKMIQADWAAGVRAAVPVRKLARPTKEEREGQAAPEV